MENVGFFNGAAGRAALSAGCAATALAVGGGDGPPFCFCDSREVDESVGLGKGLDLGSACDGVRESAMMAHGALRARRRSVQHWPRYHNCLAPMQANVAQSDLGTAASVDFVLFQKSLECGDVVLGQRQRNNGSSSRCLKIESIHVRDE